ncbi:HpcH/HpaI aldolase/citrate lyase family protein [Duganella sp. FT109W]|uniref:HpcH/HpaI aldolase/citrate lyase family protein n=1 Tax=Duganella margarita TaxID=2692170 RepID=A0ABW9WMC1_9BURK|nr:CoA ester lyase [Duganella margarita]MYN41463.1 HpcH/HpaI aldolase/citrate lyase family protein [Duganella margarita]
MTTASPFVHSYLFVPANRPERFSKAVASGANAVIIDLEDAVGAGDKTAGRNSLTNWLDSAEAHANQVPILVKVNCVNSGCFGEDLRVCRRPDIAGIVLPKAERADDIASASAGAPVYPLVETALGFSRIAELARAPRVQRLLFGAIDFKHDMGIDGDEDELLFFRSQVVLASRIAGLLSPVDGVTTEIDDLDKIARDAAYTKRLGFGGKLCIHPNQVPIVNRTFVPSENELRWANRVLEAAERARGGAVALDGRLIDRPMVLTAQRIIEDARRRIAR